jgi:hypothetical protein
MFFEPNKKFGAAMMTNGAVPKEGKNKILADVINAMYQVFMKNNK